MIRVVDRVRDQDFVLLVQQCQERGVNTECRARRDEDLRRRVVRDAVLPRQLFRDGLTQDDFAAVVRVARAAALHRARGGFDDVRWRVEIRLPAHQRDDCLAAGLRLPDLGEDRC